MGVIHTVIYGSDGVTKPVGLGRVTLRWPHSSECGALPLRDISSNSA